MKITLDICDVEERDTAQWILDEHDIKGFISEFSGHLLRKYKYQDASKERLKELEEIRETFHILADNAGFKQDWM